MNRVTRPGAPPAELLLRLTGERSKITSLATSIGDVTAQKGGTVMLTINQTVAKVRQQPLVAPNRLSRLTHHALGESQGASVHDHLHSAVMNEL